MTPLQELVLRAIRADGPLPLDRFLALAMLHPRFGYYATRDPLGADGDFTTAPEISQVFGELLGLFVAQAWLDRGRPHPAAFVEIGPGRGTAMADAWRAMRALRDVQGAFSIELVEASPVLTEVQRVRLAGLPATWHAGLSSLPRGRPLFVVANELLDVLPIRQLVKQRGRWHDRLIAADEAGRLGMVVAPQPSPLAVALPPWAGDLADGAVHEVSPSREALVSELAQLLVAQGGVALFVDYGDVSAAATGDTLQAVRRHAPVDPFADPGEADLTSRVDFGAVANAARIAGAAVHGPLTQGELLGRLGATARLDALRRAGAERTVTDAVTRLLDPAGMGGDFKALALTRPGDPLPPGFSAEDGA